MEAFYAVIPDKEKCEIRSEDLSPGDLGLNELLVRSSYSMISAGTELAGFYALSPRVYQKGSWNAYPWRPGYGTCGEIVEVGGALKGFQKGDRIFYFGRHASLQIFPLDLQGDQPHMSAFHAPATLDEEDITASRMALVAMTAPQVSGVRLGDTVVVFGLGMVGNLAAQLYQLMGARVIGLDMVESRCRLAETVGIREVLHVPHQEQVQAVLARTPGGEGAHTCVDAVGHSAVIRTCVQCARTNGKVILLGSPRDPLDGNLTDIFRPAHLKCLQILGAFEWRLPPYPRTASSGSIYENLAVIWDLIEKQRLCVRELISHVISPQEMERTYQGLMKEKDSYFGVLVDWTNVG